MAICCCRCCKRSNCCCCCCWIKNCRKINCWRVESAAKTLTGFMVLPAMSPAFEGSYIIASIKANLDGLRNKPLNGEYPLREASICDCWSNDPAPPADCCCWAICNCVNIPACCFVCCWRICSINWFWFIAFGLLSSWANSIFWESWFDIGLTCCLRISCWALSCCCSIWSCCCSCCDWMLDAGERTPPLTAVCCALAKFWSVWRTSNKESND